MRSTRPTAARAASAAPAGKATKNAAPFERLEGGCVLLYSAANLLYSAANLLYSAAVCEYGREFVELLARVAPGIVLAHGQHLLRECGAARPFVGDGLTVRGVQVIVLREIVGEVGREFLRAENVQMLGVGESLSGSRPMASICVSKFAKSYPYSCTTASSSANTAS